MTNYATPLGSKFIELKSKMRLFTMEMVDAMAPAITWVIEKIVGLITWFNNLSQPAQSLIGIMLLVSGVLFTVIGALAFMAMGIHGAIFSLGEMKLSIAATKTALSELGGLGIGAKLSKAFELAQTAFSTFKAFIVTNAPKVFSALQSFATSSIGQFAIVVGGLALLAYAFEKNFFGIKDTVSNVVETVMRAIHGLLSSINYLIEGMILLGKTGVGGIVGVVAANIASDMKGNLADSQKAINDALAAGIEHKDDWFENYGSPMQDAIDAFNTEMSGIGESNEQKLDPQGTSSSPIINNSGDYNFNFPQGTDNQTIIDTITEAFGLESLQAGGVTG